MAKDGLRNSTKFMTFIALNALLLLAFALHATGSGRPAPATVAGNASLVRELRLTDLCIFTEARYTRHPAMADNHAPFQEHPSAFEHFPSGSLFPPVDRISGGRHAQP